MKEEIEDILLRKTGANRVRIENLEKSFVGLLKRLDAIERRLTAAILSFEANSPLQDREAYLKGENPQQPKTP